MLNIYFKGDYHSDDQIIKREFIPENAVEYGIVTDLWKEFGRGFLMLMPVFVIMVAATIMKIRNTDYHLKMGWDIIISFFMVIISVHILTLVHEVIHALFYPKDQVKEIWKAKEQGAYFVYCEAEISRNRFVAMCLAPMFILGIIPFIIWLILPEFLPMPYSIAAAIVFWLMTIVAMGDVANVYHTLKEVPADARIFNHGLMQSFYIRKNSNAFR